MNRVAIIALACLTAVALSACSKESTASNPNKPYCDKARAVSEGKGKGTRSVSVLLQPVAPKEIAEDLVKVDNDPEAAKRVIDFTSRECQVTLAIP